MTGQYSLRAPRRNLCRALKNPAVLALNPADLGSLRFAYWPASAPGLRQHSEIAAPLLLPHRLAHSLQSGGSATGCGRVLPAWILRASCPFVRYRDGLRCPAGRAGTRPLLPPPALPPIGRDHARAHHLFYQSHRCLAVLTAGARLQAPIHVPFFARGWGGRYLPAHRPPVPFAILLKYRQGK